MDAFPAPDSNLVASSAAAVRQAWLDAVAAGDVERIAAMRVARSRLERVPRGMLLSRGFTSQPIIAGTARLSPIDSICR